MKRVCVVYLGILFSMFLILGLVGSRMIHSIYETQSNVVSNLAGALFTESGTEADIANFIDGIRETTPERIEAGRELLAGYGYSERWLFTIQGSYTRTMRQFWLLLGVFFVLFSGVGIFYFFQNEKRRKMQLTELRKLLTMCQREDYAFSEDEESLSKLYDPQFADNVVKLGQNLALKTRQLEEEKDQTKTLVTDISHQLKTPVSALKSCFAMSMETEGEEQTRFLEACNRQIERLERLMEALIQVSRMEQGMIHIQPSETYLTDILVEAVNIVYHKAQKKEITFDTESLEEQECKVMADSKWSVEAIANLLDNAVKYSPEGSRIQIRAQKLYSFIEIEIEDEGIGIPKEEQTLIFKRFYRGKSEIIKREDGWGIGLYLSRKILEEQGGSLFMRQGKERGSIFIIHLPYL
ncbi:MAG: HAMP domain-containing histidine kinase [Lachnospiraceae bacterium]|nr:HAMP domain-containing histidine kinase [Lachnospiraceae bacterium]